MAINWDKSAILMNYGQKRKVYIIWLPHCHMPKNAHMTKIIIICNVCWSDIILLHSNVSRTEKIYTLSYLAGGSIPNYNLVYLDIKTSHYNPTHKNYFHRASKFAKLSHCHAYSSFEIAICPHPQTTKENK